MNQAEIRHMLTNTGELAFLQHENEKLNIDNANLKSRIRELEYDLAKLTRK